ncbi:hypothetical protein VUR80DRAFT_2304 [Thermomyces stellatus]
MFYYTKRPIPYPANLPAAPRTLVYPLIFCFQTSPCLSPLPPNPHHLSQDPCGEHCTLSSDAVEAAPTHQLACGATPTVRLICFTSGQCCSPLYCTYPGAPLTDLPHVIQRWGQLPLCAHRPSSIRGQDPWPRPTDPKSYPSSRRLQVNDREI